MIRLLVEQQDVPRIAEVFTDVIDASYGIKSEDGKYFRKSPEALFDFKSTRAYNVLFMELVGNPQAAIEFFKGIIPEDLAANLSDDDINKELGDVVALPAEK